MISVAVTGSRELGLRTREDVIGAFDTFLLPFARLGARWVLGGAAGIDTVELCHPAGVGPAAWTARNMFMVDQSQIVIGFPATDVPDQSGTWETLQYARRRRRALLTVPASWPFAG